MSEDVLRRIEDLRRRRHNIASRELERLALDASWTYARTRGSHAIYVKEGVWANLAIPRHTTVRGNLALKLLNLIEASVLGDAEEGES